MLPWNRRLKSPKPQLSCNRSWGSQSSRSQLWKLDNYPAFNKRSAQFRIAHVGHYRSLKSDFPILDKKLYHTVNSEGLGVSLRRFQEFFQGYEKDLEKLKKPKVEKDKRQKKVVFQAERTRVTAQQKLDITVQFDQAESKAKAVGKKLSIQRKNRVQFRSRERRKCDPGFRKLCQDLLLESLQSGSNQINWSPHPSRLEDNSRRANCILLWPCDQCDF